MLTKLQLLVLSDARNLAVDATNDMHRLSRTHNFVGPLCQFDTPEHDLLKKIQKIEEILAAVILDKG